ncbi:MAG: isochorismatase family protein, partial [Colwellia sp.]
MSLSRRNFLKANAVAATAISITMPVNIVKADEHKGDIKKNVMGTDRHQLNANAAVLFIEFQNEWVASQGNLRRLLITDDTDFKKAILKAKKLLALARKNSLHIFHITLQPDKAYKVLGNAQFGLRAAIPHAGTWQDGMQNIHTDFLPLADEIVITERTGASAFSGSMLDSVLRNNKIDTLYLAGFASHVCVESTLREAHDKGYTCYVITDATAAFNTEQQQHFETE